MANDDPKPTLPQDYVNPGFWGGLGNAVYGDLSDLAHGVYNYAGQPSNPMMIVPQAVAHAALDTGRAMWNAGPDTVRRVMNNELQFGTPEFEDAARTTAFTYGLPGGASGEEGVLGAGMRPRGPRSLSRGRTMPDEPLPELDTPPPAMGGNNPPGPPSAPFPQYAESYPPTGRGVTKVNEKGKEYLAKKLTPEEEAFKAARQRVMADMKKKGYTPYFDPAQRTHVDPANYPPANVDTTKIQPKTQKTLEKHTANIDNPEVRARLQTAYERGKAMPDTSDWYAMAQLENEFIKELGPVEGRRAFQERFATSMAATTGGADPASNLLAAGYGNYLRHHGLPYPRGAYEMPHPIGGRYITGNMEQHQKIFDQGGYSALGAGNPKRHNFTRDFMGDPNAATMDEQMVSGMTPGLAEPPSNTYGLYENVVADEASKVDPPVTPQNYQGVSWAGFKQAKTPGYTRGQPMISVLNDAIERTHRLTGMSREEILRRGVIRGEIPLYAGGSISGAIASSAAQAAQAPPQGMRYSVAPDEQGGP